MGGITLLVYWSRCCQISSGDDLQMRSNAFLILLLILALVGGVALLVATRWGIGVSPDSILYISAARALLAGHGFSLQSPGGGYDPITHFPPLYSGILAVIGLTGVEVGLAARIINVLVFAASIFLVGYLLNHWSDQRAKWIVLAGVVLLLASWVSLEIHLMAWSEPLFIFLGLLSLVVLGRDLDSPETRFLLVAAILTGLAFLTRYAGAALLATGMLGLFLFSPMPILKRFFRACWFGAVSLIPIGLWLLRNSLLNGSAAGRQFIFHAPGKAQLSQALTTLASWLLIPDTARTLVKVVVVLVVGLGIFAAILYGRERKAAGSSVMGKASATPGAIKLLGLYLLVYAGFLVFSISFIDANTPLDGRILSPVFVFGLILAGYAAIEVSHLPFSRKGWIKLIAGIAALAFCILYLLRGSNLIIQSYSGGIGYSSTSWRNSETLKGLTQIPKGVTVYTNIPDGVFFLTGQPVYGLPSRYESMNRRANPEFSQELMEIRDLSQNNEIVIVYFKGFDQANLPSEQELVDLLQAQVLNKFSDGTIYRVIPK
jgi:hypothetical protein